MLFRPTGLTPQVVVQSGTGQAAGTGQSIQYRQTQQASPAASPTYSRQPAKLGQAGSPSVRSPVTGSPAQVGLAGNARSTPVRRPTSASSSANPNGQPASRPASGPVSAAQMTIKSASVSATSAQASSRNASGTANQPSAEPALKKPVQYIPKSISLKDLQETTDEILEAEANKVKEQFQSYVDVQLAEAEKTHFKTYVGSGIGSESAYPKGRYIVRRLLGKGAYGKVLECSDLKWEGCLVAVKVLRDKPEYRWAGEKEVRVLQALKGHCGVLRMCRTFDQGNHLCIAVDLYGESLIDKLKRVGTLTLEQVADVGVQLLHGLQHMHACGITHTDMKTENILVYHRFDQEDILHERDDVRLPLTVRIVDLGSATFESEWHQPIIGTNEYRAPEGILQLGWSFEVDVWAVGCIMFELLTGKKLFGETMADNVHLILMERCLEKALPQSMLQKAWSMGGAREKQVLVAEGPAGKNQVIGISSICQDMLQAKTVKDSTKLADEVSDEVLNELLMEFFEYEPDRRKKAGPLRKHRFFDRCRFDLSRLDTTDSLSPLTVNLDEQAAHSPPPWNEPKINANSAEKGNDLPRSTSNPPDRNMLTPPSGRIRPVKTPPISPLLGAAKTAESAEVFY